VRHTHLFGGLDLPLTLNLFLFDAGFPGVLHREHAPGTAHRSLQGIGVVQIPPDDLRSKRRQRFRDIAVGVARHRSDRVARGEEFTSCRPALLAGRAGYQDHITAYVHL
jgi:hypothetical protein